MVKTDTILQSESSECGLACIAILLNYYGHGTSLQLLREQYELSNRGMSLRNLIEVANQLNFETSAVKIQLDELKQIREPIIIHWQFDHFIILERVKGSTYYVNDPATGRKRLSINEFSNHFTGVALLLTPNNNFTQNKAPKDFNPLSAIENKTRFFHRLFRVFIYSLIFQVAIIASPIYLQIVIDKVINNYQIDTLIIITFAFVIILLLEVIFNYLRGILVTYLGGIFAYDVALKTFKHLLHLPLPYFVKRHVGDLVSRFTAIQRFRALFTSGVVESIISGITAALSLGLMLYYSLTLTLIAIIAVFIYTLVKISFISKTKQINDQIFHAESQEQTNFYETIKAIEQVKLTNRQDARASLWSTHIGHTLKADIDMSKLNLQLAVINRLIFGLDLLIIVYLCIPLIINNQFTLGMLFAFIFFRRNFVTNYSSLIDNLTTLNVVINVHFKKLSDIIQSKTEPTQSTTNSQTSRLPQEWSIKINNISYRYSDFEPPVIKNLSLTIPAGTSIAITGKSGEGKTTLLKLILGLFQPSEGQILVGNQDIWTTGIESYRSAIAAIMQEDELLTGTILENIAFFAPNIDIEWAKQCAKAAHIDQDIEQMPMAYNTHIGNMGGALSGGQKQRIYIARALYLKPQILFMDEATSHLDHETEIKINKTIKQMKVTRIIIAHRKETINAAERIYLMKNGRLEEIQSQI